jgi:hypothetical protein
MKKQTCPHCHTSDYTHILDLGFKFIYRFLIMNNRFACRKCSITWRENKPMSYQPLFKAKKKTGGADIDKKIE